MFIVYGLCDKDGNVRYVGMTKNHNQRHKQHVANKTNNIRLTEFISNNGVNMSILHVCDTYTEMRIMEVKEIKSRANLLNMVYKKFKPFSVSKPWMAGTGIDCPSAMAIKYLAKQGKDVSQFKKYRDSLSDVDRAWYELKIAADLWENMAGWRGNIMTWRNRAEENMERFLPILKRGTHYA